MFFARSSLRKERNALQQVKNDILADLERLLNNREVGTVAVIIIIFLMSFEREVKNISICVFSWILKILILAICGNLYYSRPKPTLLTQHIHRECVFCLVPQFVLLELHQRFGRNSKKRWLYRQTDLFLSHVQHPSASAVNFEDKNPARVHEHTKNKNVL